MATDVLANVPLFRGVRDQDLALLASACRCLDYDSQVAIFAQGDLAETLYVLVSGRVAIRYKPYDGEPITVAEVLPGDVFGWSAVLRRPAFTSGAVALEPSRVLAISGVGLRRLCRARPEAASMIMDQLVAVIPDRLKGAHAQVVEMLREGLHPCDDDE